MYISRIQQDTLLKINITLTTSDKKKITRKIMTETLDVIVPRKGSMQKEAEIEIELERLWVNYYGQPDVRKIRKKKKKQMFVMSLFLWHLPYICDSLFVRQCHGMFIIVQRSTWSLKM